jgi:hypothetical protein
MKLRLHGTRPSAPPPPNGCAAPPPPRPGESRSYPDRGGELVRVYLTVHLNSSPGPEEGSG